MHFFAATIPPPRDRQDPSTGAQFYRDVYIMVPMVCAAIVLVSAPLLGYIALQRRLVHCESQYTISIKL